MVKAKDDILELLRQEGAAAAKKKQRGLIIQPGAIGDCILTLPLAGFMKENLGLGSIDMFGHTEYIGVFPGRTVVDRVFSVDSLDLHRLFVKPEQFELGARDPLITAFAGYSWIVTFLGEPDSDFEQNLIFTANCSYGSEIITMPAKAPKGFADHIIRLHIERFVRESGLTMDASAADLHQCLMTVDDADRRTGQEVLAEAGVDNTDKAIIIHPGSGGAKKIWHLDNVLSVAQELRSAGFVVLLLLGPAELERFNRSTLKRLQKTGICLSNLSLREVTGVLSCARAFVGNDSGITHMAATLGAKTVAMFGPTDPVVYRPVGPNVTTLKGGARTFAAKETPRLRQKLLNALRAES